MGTEAESLTGAIAEHQSAIADMDTDVTDLMNRMGGSYLPNGANIDNLAKEHSGMWVYSRAETDGTFPLEDSDGTIVHMQGTSSDFATQILRSNYQSNSDSAMYMRHKTNGVWGAWQRYVSAKTTRLTITRIDNSYCTAQDISYLVAYKKGGFLSLQGHIHVTNATTANVSETSIATISGWNGMVAALIVPGQWSPKGSRPIYVAVNANGRISIGAYSGLLASDWYRFCLTVPCTDGYE